MTPPDPRSRLASPWWLYSFLLAQFVCQTALIAPLGPARIGFRAAVFLSSLAPLLLLPGGGRAYPVRPLAGLVLGLMAVGLAHPWVNSVWAALAQVLLITCAWAPVFWVGRVAVTPAVFRRMFLLLWGYNTLSAAVGVLQTYDERFLPSFDAVVQVSGEDYLKQLTLVADDGRRVFRPPGLTDLPGGAGIAGSFAVLGGLGAAVGFRSPLIRLAAGPAAAVGMYAIFMSQIRVALVVTVLGAAWMVAAAAARGRQGTAAWLAGLSVGAIGVGFVWAASVSDKAVTERVLSLVADGPTDVYYANRGHFVEETLLEHLPRYPLGAGPGRFGMMATYFGDPSNLAYPTMHSEVQFTDWVYDGGLPLLVAGFGAVALGCWLTARLSWGRHGLADLGGAVVGYNIGTVATIFSAHVFVTQSGIIFWTLNAAFFAAVVAAPRRAG